MPALAAAAAGPALAAEAAADCFDARVAARIVRQVPTVIPDCGEDCIVMYWPWLLDLQVERVDKGEAPLGRLTVLTLQHTYYIKRRDSTPWLLRRNDLGGFNLLRAAPGAPRPGRCAPGTPPASPYLRPAPGQTLDDVRREGEKRYGTRGRGP